MGLVKIVGGFLGLWIIFYLVVYLVYMTPDTAGSDSNKINEDAAAERSLKDSPFAIHLSEDAYLSEDVDSPKAKHSYGVKIENEYFEYFEPAVGTNPFLSETCTFRTQQSRDILIKTRKTTTVGVVIPARNENKNELLKTVESIIKNSGNELLQIIIVDDFSTSAISSWPEWNAHYAAANARFGSGKGEVLQILRLHHRNGVAKAKAFGAEHLRMDKLEVLVFLDAHVLVSKDWLIPLTTELNKHPQSIVYPAIDIINGDNGDLIKSENAIGAFDWSLDFRWEILNPDTVPEMKKRLPLSATDLGGHAINEDDVVSSPASPGMFAIKAEFFHDIGGIDTTLSPFGQENIELSLRVWMCGGSVLRQPCSRVAHTYRHLSNDMSVANGVTQEQVDRNVISVAELWFLPHQRETVYQSRFIGRVPYHVETGLDSRQLKQFLNVKVLRDEKCQNFEWYLKEIYPGLEMDRENVENSFKNHLSSNYLEKSLQPLIQQYEKEKSDYIENIAEIALLQKREKKPEEIDLKTQKTLVIPAVIKEIVLTPEEKHLRAVRDTLLCADMPKNAADVFSPCETILNASPNACIGLYSSMMFSCPVSCNLCGTDGQICFDFYEKKCPAWKLEGKCDSEQSLMMQTCRVTCGFCTKKESAPKVQGKVVTQVTLKEEVKVIVPDKITIVPVMIPDADSREILNHNAAPPKVEEPILSNIKHDYTTDADRAKAAAMALVTTTFVANPFVAQVLYKAGALPDPPVGLVGACMMNDRPHGRLLAHMSLMPLPAESVKKAPKIFCGIYTMESNHKKNVQATRETWGKRCDGFLAFSTVTDETIPAVNILHQGEEKYDNMWQKSRSIWKYINAHYIDQFDYFLMGGDDMLYIVENLRHYLASDEITKYAEEHNGLYLGRRFWPADQKVFNSGGAGYILDKKALAVMAPMLDSPKCYADQVGFWEDVNIAHCLKVSGDIEPYDTRDSLQRERFHPFTPGQHLDYRIPATNPDWYPKYNPFLKEGYDCCSVESISFHYCPADLTRQLHNYFYHCNDKHKEH